MPKIGYEYYNENIIDYLRLGKYLTITFHKQLINDRDFHKKRKCRLQS